MRRNYAELPNKCHSEYFDMTICIPYSLIRIFQGNTKKLIRGSCFLQEKLSSELLNKLLGKGVIEAVMINVLHKPNYQIHRASHTARLPISGNDPSHFPMSVTVAVDYTTLINKQGRNIENLMNLMCLHKLKSNRERWIKSRKISGKWCSFEQCAEFSKNEK